MSNIEFVKLDDRFIAVPKRSWTNYTASDYCDALKHDFELAMEIREALYPGISKACPVERPEE